eukprot:CAMPEP_0176074700 /NCGR_PEP_ID=MMETSP0120_2-20121206/37331_1 /TAXON_ID=160619 /ORGANISM="Kryptoperidinium foliaceum, Strain CCMP 1326" /LENGTH=196 /DNA_ID=CAMNT_0017408395 /DNA_START=112 /DNA_END=698 /DNA_ORIENTATION=+
MASDLSPVESPSSGHHDLPALCLGKGSALGAALLDSELQQLILLALVHQLRDIPARAIDLDDPVALHDLLVGMRLVPVPDKAAGDLVDEQRDAVLVVDIHAQASPRRLVEADVEDLGGCSCARELRVVNCLALGVGKLAPDPGSVFLLLRLERLVLVRVAGVAASVTHGGATRRGAKDEERRQPNRRPPGTADTPT